MKPIPVSTKITNLNKVKFHTKKILESEIRIFNNLISKIQKNPEKNPKKNRKENPKQEKSIFEKIRKNSEKTEK